MSKISNSSRIAKNTFVLYFRMIITLAVGLYTSRKVLDVLGIEDFGIYNVVAGTVTLCAFLNSTMAAGTQRFLSFEIGRGDKEKIREVFNASFTIHFVLAGTLFFICEIFCLWFLNNHLNINPERIGAANWALQFAIFSFLLGIIQIPFSAVIIARERMNIYAYLALIDVGLKLAIVYLISISSFDKLKTYSVLLFLVTCTNVSINFIYAKCSFEECKFRLCKNFSCIKDLTTFAGWNLSAHIASIFANQGINILLNVFFGSAVNAARGVTLQITGAISGFVSNFQLAAAPQITKTYAANEWEDEKKIILKTCKLSFFLLFFLSLPVLLECEFILNLWLVEVPKFTSIFVQLVLLDSLINTSANPMFQAIMATGKIKNYQIICSIGVLSSFFISLIAFKLGLQNPQLVYFCAIAVSLFLLWRRLDFLKKEIQFSPTIYFKEVFVPIIKVVVPASTVPCILSFSLDFGWIRFLAVGFSSVIFTSFSIFALGLTGSEKTFLKNKFLGLLSKLKIFRSKQ